MLFWIENTTTNNNEKLKKRVAVEGGYRYKKKEKKKTGYRVSCRAHAELVFLGQLFIAVKEVEKINPREKLSLFSKDCIEEGSR